MKLSLFAAAVAALMCNATAQTLDGFQAEAVDSNIIEDESTAPALRGGEGRQLAVVTTGACKAKTGSGPARDVGIFARPCHGTPIGYKGNAYDGIRLYIEPSLKLHSKLLAANGTTLTYTNGENGAEPVKLHYWGRHRFWDGTWSKVCAPKSGCYSFAKRYKFYDVYDVYADPKGKYITRFRLKIGNDCTIVRQYAMDDFRGEKCANVKP